DLLAHHDAAGRQRHVGGDAVVRAVDLAGCREPGTGAAVRVGAESVHLDRQHYRVSDALDGQLTVGEDLPAVSPDAGGPVGHGGVVGDVQEVLALYVVVALLVARGE